MATAATEASGQRKIIIEPLTRVEGHGKVSILLDENNEVTQARFHIVEFRGFERFIQGRPYWEVPVLVQRLCGICPVSHHLAACKAMDRIIGADVLPPTAEKLRRLMHFGQIFQSHALHFFHLCSPDLLFGFDADPKIRNVVGVIKNYPDLAKQGVLMRKFGQELIRATAGKKIHGTGAIPGGVNKNLSLSERDFFLRDLPQMHEWAKDALQIARDYTLSYLDEMKDFGTLESKYMSLVGEGGALDLYHGNLRVRDHNGDKVLDDVDYNDYQDFLAEEVRPWSYMKFPFLKDIGPEDGWYRVGPLARINACDFIDSPEAEAARIEFMEITKGGLNNLSMAYHWARMIEVLHAIEKIALLLDDPDLQGTDLQTSGWKRDEGIGLLEAPRGTLFHHYRVNESDQVEMANLIVSTTSNNEAMNRTVAHLAKKFLSGTEITEGLLNRIEVGVRAYDPCLSCATHALGKMDLEVKLFSHTGEILDCRRR